MRATASKDDLAAAAVSEWTTRLAAFTRWVGSGRKLTRTGRLTLADARELVELLDTHDVIDPTIGDRLYRTKSSEELRGLNIVFEWAKAARLVRITQGRLVAVKKNATLLERPIPLWERMFETFETLGPVICSSGWGESLMYRHFTEGILVALAGIYTHDGPVDLDHVCTWVWEAISRDYEFHDDHHRDMWQRANNRDVRRALEILGPFGAVHLHGPQESMNVTLTPLGVQGLRRRLGEPELGTPILQVKITLLDTADPMIWRRLLISPDITLDRLHMVIQAAMGWLGYHMHCFTHGNTQYGVPSPELKFLDERAITVGNLLTSPGDQLGYTYDFGDDWEHDLTLEQIVVAESGTRYPVCVAGEGACPPEDCGGVFGYEELREVLADTSHDEHENMVEWLGLRTAAEFDPTRFDVHEANQALGHNPQRTVR